MVQKVETPHRSGELVRVQQRLVVPISNDSVQLGGLQYMADEVPHVFGALQQVLNRGAIMKLATGKGGTYNGSKRWYGFTSHKQNSFANVV